MIPNMPTVGVRFDIGKLDADSHAVHAWKAFWQAVDPVTIRGSLLFDGDVDGNVFCIAVQNIDGALVKHIEATVSACSDVSQVCAEPLLAKGAEATSQQLEAAGSIDTGGSLTGNTGAARSALVEVRPDRAAAKPAPPAGAKPVSQLSRGFARSTTIGSHAARAALTGGGGFGGAPVRASTKAGVANRKTSLGKMLLVVVVVVLVAALVAAMIFAPAPEETLEGSSLGSASRATTEESSGDDAPAEAAEDSPTRDDSSVDVQTGDTSTEAPTEEDAPAKGNEEPGADAAAEDGADAQPSGEAGDASEADAAPD
jgi:hypothetical protein